MKITKNNSNSIEIDPVSDAINQHDQAMKLAENQFPIDIFPQHLQQLIMEAQKTLCFSPDYSACCLLSAASTIIGNSYQLQVKSTWVEKCNLWIALVGRPGEGKTQPINFFYKPINDQENEQYREYLKRLEEYKKDRESIENKQGVQKPKLAKKTIQDFTPEALVKSLSFNTNGLTIKSDELMGWLKNIGRYNKSGELERYLSLWSGEPVTVDRVSQDPERVDNPFLGIIGGIQPGVLHKLIQDGKGDNGTLDRILWAFPHAPQKQYWNDKDLDQKHIDNYTNLCSILENWASKTIEPKVLTLEKKAKTFLNNWQNLNADKLETATDMERSIVKKLENYTLRFALILTILESALIKEQEPVTVNVRTLQKVIRLYDYFYNTAIPVRDMINQVSSPLETLDNYHKALYGIFLNASHKNTISMREMVLSADNWHLEKGKEVKKDTIKKSLQRFVKNKKLFKKIRRGEYELLENLE